MTDQVLTADMNPRTNKLRYYVFLDEVYDRTRKNVASGQKLVNSYLWVLLENKNYTAVDNRLNDVNLSQFSYGSVSVAIEFLRVTSPYREHLSQRNAYYDRCHEWLMYVAPKECEEKLFGLR